MPADPRRDRKRLAGGVAAGLIARKIDDIAGRRYDFLNHCSPRGLKPRYRRKASHKRSAQHSNFTGEIEAEFLSRAARTKLCRMHRRRNASTPTATSSI